MLLKLAPGQLAPTSLAGSGLALLWVLSFLTSDSCLFLPIIVPTSAYPLAFPEALASWAILLDIRIQVVPSSSDRPLMRAGRRVAPFP